MRHTHTRGAFYSVRAIAAWSTDVNNAQRGVDWHMGIGEAELPPLSPPPRTLGQVFAINERLRRMAGDLRRDDALAVEEHVRFRAELQRLDTAARADHAPADQ